VFLLADTTVDGVTVRSGEGKDVIDSGSISTANAVVVNAGGDGVFWAGGQVRLAPGFRAEAGSYFQAAVDSNMNGFSDVQESIDSDRDGMCDAYEQAYGLNPNYAGDASVDSDGDGVSNLIEFQRGGNPKNVSDSGAIRTPISGATLVVVVPGSNFYQISGPSWAIAKVSQKPQ
jgi:hypothetical protein